MDKMDIATLHHITQDLESRSHAKQAKLACEGGVQWVQLRVKDKGFAEWCAIAEETKLVCTEFGAKLIINDSVDVAAAVDADGVHLGQNDTSPHVAREKLGETKIIGGTANTFNDIQRMALTGVDYVGVGPFRFTTTKKNLSPFVGLEGYKQLVQQCEDARIQLPIIAIGGVTVDDVSNIIATGVHGIAISSAINIADDSTMAASNFIQALKTQLV